MAISSWSSSQGCHGCPVNCGLSEGGLESDPHSDQHSSDSFQSRFPRVQEGQEREGGVSKLLKMLTTWTQVKAGKKFNWSGSPPAT